MKIHIKGVLANKISENTHWISAVAIIIALLPIFIIGIVGTKSIAESWILIIYGTWYFLSLTSSNTNDVFKNNFYFLIYLPLSVSIIISALIFKMFLKVKYPEIEEKLYQRQIKIKNIQQKISKRNIFKFKLNNNQLYENS